MTLYEAYTPDAVGRAVAVTLRPAVPADAERIAELDGQRNGVPPDSIVDRIRAHLARRSVGEGSVGPCSPPGCTSSPTKGRPGCST